MKTAENVQTTDYIHCITCNMKIDLWQYDSIEDTGCAGHDWRFVTEEELQECIADCKEHGCFEEVA